MNCDYSYRRGEGEPYDGPTESEKERLAELETSLKIIRSVAIFFLTSGLALVGTQWSFIAHRTPQVATVVWVLVAGCLVVFDLLVILPRRFAVNEAPSARIELLQRVKRKRHLWFILSLVSWLVLISIWLSVLLWCTPQASSGK